MRTGRRREERKEERCEEKLRRKMVGEEKLEMIEEVIGRNRMEERKEQVRGGITTMEKR